MEEQAKHHYFGQAKDIAGLLSPWALQDMTHISV